jgi:putative DNA primase/helicase
VENGTLSLRTGELHPHRREDSITKLAPVTDDPGARWPRWKAFLERILPAADVRRVVRKAAGCFATCDTSEHVRFFPCGRAANGKSTFIDALRDVRGDSAQHAGPDLREPASGTPQGSRTCVARRVATVEVEDGRHLTDSLVKQLIGRDCAKARYRRQDVFEFDIEAKFWIVSNHKPFIHGTIARSGGIWWDHGARRCQYRWLHRYTDHTHHIDSLG